MLAQSSRHVLYAICLFGTHPMSRFIFTMRLAPNLVDLNIFLDVVNASEVLCPAAAGNSWILSANLL